MPLLLYCIAGSENAGLADLQRIVRDSGFADGVGGSFRWLRHLSLAALAKEIRELPREREAIVAYGRLVAAVHRRTTVIPMRYGSQFADQDALRQHLERQCRVYQAWLERLHDCVEMGVRIPVVPQAAETPPVTGKDYLRLRRQAYSPEEETTVVQELETAVTNLYRQRQSDVGPFINKPTIAVRYLVPRADLARFKAALQDKLAERPDWTVSGPWPPYSFVAGA